MWLWIRFKCASHAAQTELLTGLLVREATNKRRVVAIMIHKEGHEVYSLLARRAAAVDEAGRHAAGEADQIPHLAKCQASVPTRPRRRGAGGCFIHQRWLRLWGLLKQHPPTQVHWERRPPPDPLQQPQRHRSTPQP